MEPANSQTQAAQAEEALEAAIKNHEAIAEGMPGSWSVETSDGSVMLVWSCDADDEAVSGMQSDEPFTAELCGGPSGPSERAPGYASAPKTEE